MTSKRIKIVTNYVVGPLLFVWLSIAIYKQIMQQQHVQASWKAIVASFTGPQAWKFGAVIGLMLANWGIEARKWQLLLHNVQQISIGEAFKAIFSGQALALNTPNRVGEYAGRILYLQDGNRLRGVMLLMVANISQLIVTFIMGSVGLLLMQNNIAHHLQQLQQLPVYSYKILTMSVCVFTVVLLLFYYNLSWLTLLAEKISWIRKYHFFIEELAMLQSRHLLRILRLSFVRYLVFTLQYLLLLQVFGVQIVWWQAAALVGIQFLVLAIVPSIALGELGVRGQISLTLFGMLSNNLVGIIATSAGIWLINLIVPAIVGSICIVTIRIFKQKSLA